MKNCVYSLLTSILFSLAMLAPSPVFSDSEKQLPVSDVLLPQGVMTEPLLDMDFIYIEPGNFMMGSPEDEANRYRDERQHSVRIDRGFWIGKYEVTFAQYDAFSKAAGYAMANDHAWGRDNRPVINVSWFDAADFAGWLSAKTGHHYRLPTEAEWEYVARAGTTTAYSFGDNPDDFIDYAWNGSSSNKQTHPVGLKRPNPWGMYDVHGNVWEWTGSAFTKDYDGSELTQSSFESKEQYAVVRGGSWYFFPKSMRSADRRVFFPGFRLPYIGFRLVRDK